MDQDEIVSPEYQKRFNDGYLIAKHMPELAAHIKDAAKELSDGFKDGIEQFEKETKTPYPSWLSKDRLSSLDKDFEQDKEKEIGEED